jgi:hypothetical protein
MKKNIKMKRILHLVAHASAIPPTYPGPQVENIETHGLIAR